MSVQVPKGYKQTEVGVIPEDWGVARLSTCLEEAPSYGINAPAVKYDLTLPAYIRITDISEDGKFIENNRASVSHPNYSSYLLNDGDLVFARTGASVGKSYLYNSNDGNLVYAGFLIKIKPNKQKLDSLFLSNYVKTDYYWSWVKTNSMRSGQPGINGSEYGSLPLVLPPLKEQQAIAEALSDADALIQSLEQLIAKKRQIKQGAMQELLTGQRRLPGFSGEWVRRRLGEICSMKSGFSITSDDIDDFSEYPCYGGNGLRGYTSKKTHSGKYALIGRQGALCGNVVLFDGDFFASEHAIVVTPSHNLDIAWFSYILERMNLNQYSESSAQPGLSVSKLLLLEEKFPPKDEQIEIANFLLAIEEEIQSLVNRLNKARQIKQSMMQELLTGRIRLI